MKTTNHLFGFGILLSSLITLDATAQPWYGQHMYKHDSTILTSAKTTVQNPGYIMAGYRAVRQVPLNQPDFVIDKVDGFGAYAAGVNFSNNYQINADPFCTNSPVPVYKCSGITVIETKNFGSGEMYAIAGCYNQGIFFATLDMNGNILKRNFWALPGPVNAIHKPGLRESKVTPGRYYICCLNYVMKVDFNAVQLWGRQYTSPPLECRDLMESPYNPNQLVVAGSVNLGAALLNDAMLLNLNSNTGAVNFLKTYNVAGWANSNELFTSIQQASSPSGTGAGYTLGGSVLGQIGGSGPFNIEYTQWMTKLDQAGNTVWSSLILPFTNVTGSQSGNEIAQVYERPNPNGTYEYYGVAGENFSSFGGGPIVAIQNIVVYKLDNFGFNSLTPNEFHYEGGGTAPNGYADLTAIETGGGANDGLQAYGTRFATNSHYMAKAYFNGVSGCKEDQYKIVQIFGGPKLAQTLTGIPSTPVSPCGPTNIFFNVMPQGNNLSVICQFASVASGSNAKILGIAGNTADNSMFTVYPNPTNGLTTITIPATYEGPVSVTVSNILGQSIKEYKFNSVSNGQCNIQLNELDLKSGMYMVQVTAGAATGSYKIMYKAE